MLEELEADISSKNTYCSKAFSPHGAKIFEAELIQAFQSGDPLSLANSLYEQGAFAERYENGRKVPSDAASKWSEGEFNRYYMRAICRLAIKSEQDHVVITRFKAVQNPRPDSEALIGRELNALLVLNDLRSSTGVEPVSGVPKPNSGLTVRLQRQSNSD